VQDAAVPSPITVVGEDTSTAATVVVQEVAGAPPELLDPELPLELAVPVDAELPPPGPVLLLPDAPVEAAPAVPVLVAPLLPQAAAERHARPTTTQGAVRCRRIMKPPDR
jgi:hypothetical protein